MADDGSSSGLPSAARARLAEIRESGTWGSALSTAEFAAIRSTGFEPVGQVLGAAVYNIGYTGGFNCPGAWSGMGRYGVPAVGITTVSGDGNFASFGPMVATLYQARRAALGRMTAECAALGGHGVVGVTLTIGSFPAGGLEFKAIGTAVRGPGPPLARPFTSDLSGQDFAKLFVDGWMPAGLVLGISVGARHDDWLTVSQTRYGSGNNEVLGYTEVVTQTRHDAREQLEYDVARLGADGVVVTSVTTRVRERDCPAAEGRRDHIVEATVIGTAIARFHAPSRAAEQPSLAIMSLDPQRRQAARVRLGP
ncbi:MAG TPA: heavy metal-binding domain-containing protein [Streptosporangiaceae bacterium]